ncbi:MAG TPA: hypothetical protein VFO66_01220 [Gemmatimonadaceae bacterium]|nr:hypothetical protein [Gemmatimonadaceae bacterium]
MRTAVKVTLAAIALIGVAGAIAACSDAQAGESAGNTELQRDLELASAATIALAGRAVDSANLSSLETRPISAPEKATVVKRGAGPRAVRSKAPTVRSAPDPVPAASEGEGEALAESEAPAESEPVAIVPVPAPVVGPTAPAGDYGSGGGIFGSGGGRIGGGGGGVVIRGGGVDGDNCELHRRPRGNRGPIYVPAVPTSRPTTVSTGTRGGFGGGTRNTGTVSRRPEPSSASPRAPRETSRPGRATDPRAARRGL